MVTITCDPLRGSGILKRPSVNGLQFIEAEILRGSGVLTTPKIGSSTPIHSVLDWTPDDGDEDQEIGRSVAVNFDADNTSPLDLDYSDGAEFEATGTHDQTVGTPTGVELNTSAPDIGFEDYNLAVIDAAGQPDLWQWLGGDAAWKWTVQDNANNWDGKHAVITTGNGQSWTGFTGETYWSAVYSMDVYHDSSLGSSYRNCYIAHQLQGSGTALSGYCIEFGEGQYVSFKRVYSSTYTYGISSANVGTVPVNSLYHVKVKFTNNGTTTWCYVKRWLATASEPADYLYAGSDTWYANRAGWTGLAHKSGSGNGGTRIDNFKIEPTDPEYHSSGEWTSDPLDVSDVETLASSKITFDTTTPTDTSATVKCRWKDGETWLACTSGEPLPGIDYREDMRPGATKDELELRIELATTDTTETPSVDNLLVEFRPCFFSDVEIVVDGNSATIENEHLVYWGREQLDAGSIVEAWDDLNVAAFGFESYRLNGESILAQFLFSGFEIDSIGFSQLLQAYKVGASIGYFGFLGAAGAIEANATVQYTVRPTWSPIGHDYQWTLIDKTQGIHADGWFWVGHAQIDDFPGSIIAGVPELADFPGSVLARAYRCNDFPGSTLVQGWRHDDFPGSVLPARVTHNDFPGSIVVAVPSLSDFPGSILVYGVNRDNEIEIHQIDAATVAELEALGFTFPPEAT